MFDGKVENRSKPKDLSGIELLQQLNGLEENNFGKHPNKMKRKSTPEELNWTKKSIFFELPYWKTMKLRHNLDVMHIEKNICDNILGTMLNIEGKTKDTVNARLDLEDMKIKKEIHLKKMEDGSFLPLGSTKYELLSYQEFEMMQWYILTNCDEVEPYMEKHKMEIQLQNTLSIEERHRAEFPLWFRNYVANQDSKEISDELLSLAYGPDKRAQKYTGCIVNGVRFHTKARDEHLTSQNSGVMVEGNHEEDQINFYGILTDIIQLNYIKDYKVVLFKCKWFDLGNKRRRIYKDGNLLSINISKCWYDSDPFILSVQAKQVFYLDDTKLGKDWRVVQKFHHRHLYDVPEKQVVENDDVSDVDDEFETYDCNAEMQISENISLCRDDIIANTINCEIVDNVNVLIDSDDQESEDDNEGGEIELDEYDTDIEHIF
ncbi:hypothetical protein V6N11_051692 [Hibiscus sabdariffa]|uniref:DUF4216 domain-containing protein n=1 Tax=Hibiscus sabdariffa TaxID=183260 RepID=A0ABR2U8L1_9ROSI